MKRKIAVLGDLIIDKFLYFESTKLSPEGPGPVVRKLNDNISAGGSGNVAISLINLGFEVDLFYLKPSKPNLYFSDLLNQIFKSHKIKLCPCKSNLTNPIPIKTRYYVDNRQFMREDTEEKDIENQTFLINKLEELDLQNYSAIVVSDYQKGFFSDELLQFLINKCNERLIPIFIDTKNKNNSSIKNAFCLKINESEFNILFKNFRISKTTNFDLVLENVCSARKSKNIFNLIVTRGSLGSVSSNPNENIYSPAKKVEVNDITGAGDAFLAGIIYSFLKRNYGNKNKKFVDNQDLKLGNLASSSVILYSGTVPISEKFVSELKQSSEIKIGFTNGCFDLLHEGHIEILKKAKESCDYLIVGLNSDISVKKLKGESRPVKNQESRKMVLESIKYVDEVIIFEEETPLELIKKINPFVLIKGADYSEDEIVGGSYVKNNGGKVIRVNLIPNKSSSRIINSIFK